LEFSTTVQNVKLVFVLVLQVPLMMMEKSLYSNARSSFVK